MQVYIEYAVFDNLIVDFFLLAETARLLKVGSKKLRLIASSVLGTVVAVVLPIADVPMIIAFIIKIISAMVMTLIAVKHTGVLSYVKFFNVFLLLTFLLGGTIVGILSLMGIPYDLAAYYSNKLLPIGLNVLFAVFVAWGIKKFLRFNVSSVCVATDLYETEIVVGGVKFKAVAFFDNGNRLHDEATGLPIIVCKRGFFKKLTDKVELKPRGVLGFNTVAGNSSKTYYFTDYVVVKNGKVGTVRHAFIMQGDVNVSGADVIVGKSLVQG